MSARVDVAELLARARARGAAGDLEAAEGALRQVLAAEPRNPQALHLLGITRWHAGDGAGALAPLRGASAASRSAESRYALGRASQILAGPGDALERFARDGSGAGLQKPLPAEVSLHRPTARFSREALALLAGAGLGFFGCSPQRPNSRSAGPTCARAT